MPMLLHKIDTKYTKRVIIPAWFAAQLGPFLLRKQNMRLRDWKVL